MEGDGDSRRSSNQSRETSESFVVSVTVFVYVTFWELVFRLAHSLLAHS